MGPYLGDYKEDDTLYYLWDTNDASGASITRSTNGTVSVYKDNGTTQSVAGVTDTEDFDSLTGIHLLTIDLSADAFYATGADYNVVLSAATIDTQTVNAVLCTFSIENRFDEVDATKISGDSTAADNLEAAYDGAGYAGGTIKQTVDAVAISGDTTAADNLEAAYDGTGYVGGSVKQKVDAVAINSDTTAAAIAALLYGSAVIRGTVNDGAPTSSSFIVNLTDDPAGENDNDFWNNAVIVFTNNNLQGQPRKVSDYVGASQTLTVGEAFFTAPANGDAFLILGFAG